MKTQHFRALTFVCLLLVSTPFYAKLHRGTSSYGMGQLSALAFSPSPPVQNPNRAITETMEICAAPGNQCGTKHSFIYEVLLAGSDPGAITSITLTVNAQSTFQAKKNFPTFGVLTCDSDGALGIVCGPDTAFAECAINSIPVTESGVGTSTYTQTWDFSNAYNLCNHQVFDNTQLLAIFVDLCVNDNDDSQCNADTDPPYLQRPVIVTINVSRPAGFVAIPPCRIVDTRNENGPFGGPSLQGGVMRTLSLPDSPNCSLPSNAIAYLLNVTVVPSGPLGYLTVWPTGDSQPPVSTLNSMDGRVKANAAIVQAGDYGAIDVYATNPTDLAIDINGYFVAVGNAPLVFYPLAPCRVANTSNSNLPEGLGPPSLAGQKARDFPILKSTCGIPNSAQAYSLNFTVVPHGPLGYLTVWPSDQKQPGVSTLNAVTGTPTANAAIVSGAVNDGDISVFASNDTDLVIDINGYFAPPEQGGLSLYPVAPCRALDTRQVGNGQPFVGELTVDVVGSVCAPPSAARAYVFNTTVVPSGPLGYLTLWPDGTGQPVVSTLNAVDGAVTSNMAIVPTNNGQIDAFASNPTQLIMDVSGYFAP
jgi:hypothetical protein